jgi:hypothetical protein
MSSSSAPAAQRAVPEKSKVKNKANIGRKLLFVFMVALMVNLLLLTILFIASP